MFNKMIKSLEVCTGSASVTRCDMITESWSSENERVGDFNELETGC